MADLLTTADRDSLARALHSAYHNAAELAQLVLFTLGERLDDLAEPGTLPARVMAVIQWAEAQGRLDELVRAAYDRRPGNPSMRAFHDRFVAAHATTSETAQGPHVILFLAADPAATAPLRLDEECAAIERELRMTAARDDFAFRSKWAVTVDDVMRYLNELRPTVIHFSGHGGRRDPLRASREPARRDIEQPDDGGIWLHGEHGEPQAVSGPALARLIAAAAPSARIVVLNACFTSAIAGPLREVVDCVVGMSGAIGDDAARMFAVGFYRALGYGGSIANAVQQGVAALGARQLQDQELPACWTRDNAIAERVILSPARPRARPGA